MSTLNRVLASVLALASARNVLAEPYNTFDGDGFPACNDVALVHNATSVDDIVSYVKNASANNTPIRASGKGHMWYVNCANSFIPICSILSVSIRIPLLYGFGVSINF